jgi:photosystem II stability/assembly factor-like uncharacterized protein
VLNDLTMKFIFPALLMLLAAQFIKAQSVTVVEQGQPCSIRGLSVVNNKVAWASGSNGHVALSTDGGHSWKWQQVKAFPQSDFRDIEAFSDKEAIIMSSGTPALILKTTDGGINWQVCYRNNDKAYFLDGIAFTTNTKHGFVMGDPINGKFILLETKDAGTTWTPVTNAPAALPGEAAFAASGTCIRVNNQLNSIILVTGGSVSRIHSALISQNLSGPWQANPLPLLQGKDSQGAFSFANQGRGSRQVIVGGDYQYPNRTDSVACNAVLLEEIPFNASLPRQAPSGYQSCVEYLQESSFISTGTSGTNLSTDGGQIWQQIDTGSFNVCQRAKSGNLVLLAGDKGKIALFKNQ